jgi:hypothetical protein
MESSMINETLHGSLYEIVKYDKIVSDEEHVLSRPGDASYSNDNVESSSHSRLNDSVVLEENVDVWKEMKT